MQSMTRKLMFTNALLYQTNKQNLHFGNFKAWQEVVQIKIGQLFQPLNMKRSTQIPNSKIVVAKTQTVTRENFYRVHHITHANWISKQYTYMRVRIIWLRAYNGTNNHSIP